MRRIHETLFILHKCSTTIGRLYEAYDVLREKGPLFSFKHFSHELYRYMIMETVSFLDEYDSFFVPARVELEFGDRVRDVRKVCLPLYQKIRSWKGLADYRNKVVAHGWRDKKNDSRLTVPNNRFHDIPTTLFEVQLMKDLIIQLFEVIKLEFQLEADEALSYAYRGGRENEMPKKNLYTNINSELQQMLDAMNQISKEIGKNYDIRIQGYLFSRHAG